MRRAGATSQDAQHDLADPEESGDPVADGARRVTVIIPAKNEAQNIGWVLSRLPPVVDEVVLIDATSTDRTIDVARSHRPDIIVITDDGRGKGAAVRAGVCAASGDDVVMLDADGSMDPSEIDRFIHRLREGHDLVKGSRFLPEGGTADMTYLRKAGHWGLLTLANLLFGTTQTDLCYGYAAFRRDAFQALALAADGFEIEAQLFLRSVRTGLRVAEVASFESPRRYGNSNLNTFRDGWRVLRTIVEERRRDGVGVLAPVASTETSGRPEAESRSARRGSSPVVAPARSGYRDP
jgi:glycosyltransferase involved in cell wall biosynthesis